MCCSRCLRKHSRQHQQQVMLSRDDGQVLLQLVLDCCQIWRTVLSISYWRPRLAYFGWNLNWEGWDWLCFFLYFIWRKILIFFTFVIRNLYSKFDSFKFIFVYYHYLKSILLLSFVEAVTRRTKKTSQRNRKSSKSFILYYMPCGISMRLDV